MSQNKSITAAIIGDVIIDHICDGSSIDLPGTQDLHNVYFLPIKSQVGGNAIFFAQTSKEAGFDNTYLMASLGYNAELDKPDVAAELALVEMSKLKVKPLIAYDKKKETGKVMMIYHPNDKRLMIADRGANASFNLDNLPDYQPLLGKVDLLYISGYMLLEENQRKGIQYLAKQFSEAGAFVFVDVVPHQIFDRVSLEEYAKWIPACDCIAIEGFTARGFLQDSDSGTIDESLSPQTIGEELLKHFDFCLVRLNENSDYLIADKTRQIETLIPYKENIASLRFTDRVIANVLLSYLRNNRQLIGDFNSPEFLSKIALT